MVYNNNPMILERKGDMQAYDQACRIKGRLQKKEVEQSPSNENKLKTSDTEDHSAYISTRNILKINKLCSLTKAQPIFQYV